MAVQELEREYSPTLIKSTEIQGLQTQDNVIFFNSPRKIERARNLQINRGLQEANWQSEMEIKRFVDDINTDLAKGLTLEEAVIRSTGVFEQHIRYYDSEFIEQEPVLLHSNNFGLWSGEQRLLGNNGRPVIDAIDSRERGGAVKRVAKKIEEDLLEADNNSFIVLMSPQGVSGYLDGNGCDIPHLNTLTMVFWKDEHGDYKGITIVTDLRVDQAEQVMADLGAPANFFAKKGTEMQRLVNILENSAKPSLPKVCKNPFEYVFDTILAVRGEGDIKLRQKKGPPEIRPVKQVWQKIKDFQSLLELTFTKQQFVGEFKKFILDHFQKVGDPDFQQALTEIAEETILLFARDYLKRRNSQIINRPIIFPQYTESAGKITILRPPDHDFRLEIAFLQSRGGCPSSTLTSLAGRSSSVGNGLGLTESDSMGSLYFPCPVCGAIIKRPWEGYAKRCDTCGATEEIACESSDTKKEKQDNQENQLVKAA